MRIIYEIFDGYDEICVGCCCVCVVDFCDGFVGFVFGFSVCSWGCCISYCVFYFGIEFNVVVFVVV